MAGAVVGLLGAAALALGAFIGLPALASAALSLAVMVLSTGAFHEDGLADTADSLGAYTTQTRLEVMRDSRVGTFGASALVISMILRVSLAAALLEDAGVLAAAAALVAGESVSRAASLAIGYSLEPARSDGAAISAGRPSGDGFFHAGLIGALTTAILVAPTLGLWAGTLAIACVYLAAFAMVRFCAHAYGGQTGDVAGATQQVANLVFLAVVTSLR